MEFELIEGGRDAFMSHARKRAQEMAERDPAVGDIVHFWDGSACRAAIVTLDELFLTSLAFLMPGETSWRPVHEAEHDEDKGEYTWHWPEMTQ